jgi:hypothetical protein
MRNFGRAPPARGVVARSRLSGRSILLRGEWRGEESHFEITPVSLRRKTGWLCDREKLHRACLCLFHRRAKPVQDQVLSLSDL